LSLETLGGAAAGSGLDESAGVLASTSAAKASLACDASNRAGFGGAAWKDTLATTSDVTLTKVGLSQIELRAFQGAKSGPFSVGKKYP